MNSASTPCKPVGANGTAVDAGFPDDPRVEEILALFAAEARVDRALLQPQARADSLGVGSLDLTLALFALEDRFDVNLPELPGADGSAPTVGELVRRVLQALPAAAEGHATAAPLQAVQAAHP